MMEADGGKVIFEGGAAWNLAGENITYLPLLRTDAQLSVPRDSGVRGCETNINRGSLARH